jgi:hypothetical protein
MSDTHKTNYTILIKISFFKQTRSSNLPAALNHVSYETSSTVSCLLSDTSHENPFATENDQRRIPELWLVLGNTERYLLLYCVYTEGKFLRKNKT